MDTSDKRRGLRRRTGSKVTFRKPREMGYEINLKNLSQHGCRVMLRERVQPGQLVWLTLPGIEVLPSWVRWRDEWTAGLEFERPMHVAVFDHLAAQLGCQSQ